MERLSAGFERHDVDGILDCFTDDGIFDITEGPDPWGERFQGKAEIRKALEALFSALRDVQFMDASHWVAGDRGTSEWTCVGTTAKGRAAPRARAATCSSSATASSRARTATSRRSSAAIAS